MQGESAATFRAQRSAFSALESAYIQCKYTLSNSCVPIADGSAHGVLLMNSNGMDVVLTESAATFRVVGGVVDLYFLMGPTPLDVLDQLTRLVGRPALPPYWALGLQQSKCANLRAIHLLSQVKNFVQRCPCVNISEQAVDLFGRLTGAATVMGGWASSSAFCHICPFCPFQAQPNHARITYQQASASLRRYGYQSVQEYQTIVDGYTNAGIPLETFVSDSQYMDYDQDFTLGAKFPLADMQAFVARLHSKGQRWVRSTLILLPPP